MSWAPSIYLAFASRAAAKTAIENVLGRNLASVGDLTDGDGRLVLVAPITEWISLPTYTMAGGVITQTDPGQQRAGFWVMVRLRLEWAGYAAAVAAMSPRVQSLATPRNVFFGE